MACRDLFAGTDQPACNSVSRNVKGPTASDVYLCNFTKKWSWDSTFFLVGQGLSMAGGLASWPRRALQPLLTLRVSSLKATSRKLCAIALWDSSCSPCSGWLSSDNKSSHYSWLKWGLTINHHGVPLRSLATSDKMILKWMLDWLWSFWWEPSWNRSQA